MASTPAAELSSADAEPGLLPVLLPPAVAVGTASGLVAALPSGRSVGGSRRGCRRPRTASAVGAGRRSPYACAVFVPAWTVVAPGCYALLP